MLCSRLFQPQMQSLTAYIYTKIAYISELEWIKLAALTYR